MFFTVLIMVWLIIIIQFLLSSSSSWSRHLGYFVIKLAHMLLVAIRLLFFTFLKVFGDFFIFWFFGWLLVCSLLLRRSDHFLNRSRSYFLLLSDCHWLWLGDDHWRLSSFLLVFELLCFQCLFSGFIFLQHHLFHCRELLFGRWSSCFLFWRNFIYLFGRSDCLGLLYWRNCFCLGLCCWRFRFRGRLRLNLSSCNFWLLLWLHLRNLDGLYWLLWL